MELSTALWLVYFAGVADTVGVLLEITAVVFAISTIISVIAAGVTLGEKRDHWARYWGKKSIHFASCCLAAFLIGSFVPAPTFLYMLAGLSVSQEVVQTSVGQKAITLLEQKLDEALNTPEKSK